MKRLYRSRRNSIIGGVAGGIAEYFDVDPSLVRLAWILAIFVGGAGLFAYAVAWAIVPSNPEQEWDDDWRWSSKVRKAAAESQSSAMTATGEGARTFGLILVAVGAYFLARNVLPHWGLGRFWPVLLILLGVGLIAGAIRGGR